ncbi:putative ABC transport system ATP-binding protein [Desulfacinum hydrothermale DSM 13146]|uniref:Putative ABC transport system ATP-binding protein n=1 Tax=Desulfacinum hydrothermale DSM 13146 TaxID=1121390 RepID=A0A1W1XDC7_9BACT|nr:ATP-binding cassette domain-containing protein [Desulfacinum hydrothermale]SMC21862.1 putative ABC transport system ATP-binding protein [Desulfacinum hydrothermale DSM 13146]
MSEPVLRCDHLSHTLPDGRSLFRDVCLEIHRGAWIQIAGPSGCGKTTLLRMLVALQRPQSGAIFWNGTPLDQVPGPLLRSRVVYVAQSPSPVSESVERHLTRPFHFRLHRHRRPPTREQMRLMLDKLGLEDVPWDRGVDDLSAGQRHRLALLRALLLTPQVLLLDEPMAPLDRGSQAKVEDLLEEVRWENGTSMVLVSHQEPVRKAPDTVFHLEAGRLEPRQRK